MSRLQTLTPEQEALLWVYRDRWQRLALCTDPLDRDRATQAVCHAYQSIVGEKKPIFFVANPWVMAKVLKILGQRHSFTCTWTPLHLLIDEFKLEVKLAIEADYGEAVLAQLLKALLDSHLEALNTEVWYANSVWFPFFPDRLFPDLPNHSNRALDLFSQFLLSPGDPLLSLLDFYFSVLNPTAKKAAQWTVLKEMITSTGLLFLHQNFCLICDRPQVLMLDEQNRLHGEGQPALDFRAEPEEYRVYAYHGVRLPEHYGKLYPEQWQPQWILQEKNAEVRRALIQGIGYGRLCQALEAEELDHWQDYTLLQLNHNLDIEPVLLLKMKCPSTNHIHAVRVPPTLSSARQAIQWVNWGIDPEKFSAQT